MFAHMIKKDVPDVIHYQPLYETLNFIHHVLYTSKTSGCWPLLNPKMTWKGEM